MTTAPGPISPGMAGATVAMGLGGGGGGGWLVFVAEQAVETSAKVYLCCVKGGTCSSDDRRPARKPLGMQYMGS